MRAALRGASPALENLNRVENHMLSLVFALSHDGPETPPDCDVVISDLDRRPRVFGWRRVDDYWLSVPEIGNFRFRPGSNVVTAYATPGASPGDVRDAYHGDVLPVVVQIVLGAQSIHASAVVTPGDRIVAFCGTSEAGKTTIAVGLNRRGHALWADDVVAFDARSDRLTALRLPFDVNLRESSAAYFDSLTENATVRANGRPPEWTQSPLAAFFVLDPLEEPLLDYLVQPLSASEAFIALLTQSFRFKPQTREEKRRMMQDYLELVTKLPVFRVQFREGFDILPKVLDQIEEIVGST
jgi:hypothetical protein